MLQFLNECVMLAGKVTIGTIIIFFGTGIAVFLLMFVVAVIGHLLDPKKKG